MDLLDLIGILLLAAVAWLWLDSLRAREAAMAAARAACGRAGLLLLDDTVAITRVRLGRGADGTLRLARIYAFEYSDSGDDRHPGSVALLGSRVGDVRLAAGATEG